MNKTGLFREFGKMGSNKTNTQEFTLEVDSELRFEIETKNHKVTVEVSVVHLVFLNRIV